eukprot:9045346-Alexandrium_andersonii.AAC.1
MRALRVGLGARVSEQQRRVGIIQMLRRATRMRRAWTTSTARASARTRARTRWMVATLRLRPRGSGRRP